jgi:excisionase family DNA binding protein
MNQAIGETESVTEGGFVGVTEASKFLGLSRATLYKLMNDRDLPFALFGRARRIPRRALVAYAERCMVRA